MKEGYGLQAIVYGGEKSGKREAKSEKDRESPEQKKKN